MFTHAGPDATLRDADIDLAIRTRHTVYAARRQGISSVLYRPDKLLDLLDRLVNCSDAMPRVQSAYAVRHSFDIGYGRTAEPTNSCVTYRPGASDLLFRAALLTSPAETY